VISVPRLNVPVPDGIASRVGCQFPPHVQAAVREAADATRRLGLCRGPRYEEARQYAFADLARANRVLAAHDPRLIHTWADLPNHR
jgi:hypothetical protein